MCRIRLFIPLLGLVITMALAQVPSTQLSTPPPAKKTDQAKVKERQHMVQELCVQYGRIKSLLPAPTSAKLAPAVPAVKKAWLSRPGDPEVISVATAEVRRIFGTRSQNVESVLVGYLMSVAMNCEEVYRDAAKKNQTMFENFDQKTNQLFNILSTILKTQKETESSIIRNIN